MKTNKIIYGVSTGIISIMMLLSAYQYFTDPYMVSFYKHAGFPDYFRIQIAISKIIGALVLIIPKFPGKVKEWAYAGFGILFVSAVIVHIVMNDPTGMTLLPAIFFVILIISNIYFSKIKKSLI